MKYHYRRHQHGGFRRQRGQYGRFRQKIDTLATTQGIYRSRQGIFMGVCRGLAQHFNFSVFWTRIIVFILFLFTGFWPVGVIYIVAGLLLKLEPAIPLKNETDQEFYQSYTTSRESAIQRIKRKFDNIDRRIQRMEHTVTSREFDF
ncbi:MAG: envelope stress response membrane protein PspC [Desulfobacter sp.]|nr:envelope stress response membrane protein PspC [Desulfobacter sp.]WDP87579.1 MAG: envelope stress response membrane protein PspC [Desulfobacter sp.]